MTVPVSMATPRRTGATCHNRGERSVSLPAQACFGPREPPGEASAVLSGGRLSQVTCFSEAGPRGNWSHASV